jgi:hypothetical protein
VATAIVAAGRLTNPEIYYLGLKYLPLDEYVRIREQSYREADSRHTSHRVILPSLLLAALQERGFLPQDAHVAG